MTIKTWYIKDQIDKLDFTKLKSSSLQETMSKESKDKLQTGKMIVKKLSDRGLKNL